MSKKQEYLDRIEAGEMPETILVEVLDAPVCVFDLVTDFQSLNQFDRQVAISQMKIKKEEIS